MSVLERRLQLLLSHEQYGRVAAEAKRTGRSANAVIRAAIDLHYPSTVDARTAAVTELLASRDDTDAGITADYGEFKRDLEAALNEARW